MIFVLGIMLFLLAIGVSTMAAAFANAGYIMRQTYFSRARMLHESIHENIMYSLQADPEDEDLLGYMLTMAIFRANDPADPDFVLPSSPGEPNPGFADITDMQITLDGISLADFGGRITLESITITFPNQLVSITEAVPAIAQDPPGATGDNIITHARPREPRTATVNASMIVEVTVRSVGRSITSIAVFEYTGGRLTDDPDGANSGVTADLSFEMVFEKPALFSGPDDRGGYGRWRMVRHEFIDWQG
jgi:hypothetical protein